MKPVLVQAPSSKSVSHRTVIGAALAEGRSKLTRVLDSDDLQRTMGCMRAMGAVIEQSADVIDVVGAAGCPDGSGPEPADLNVGESGTTCRLLTGVAAAGKGRFLVHGEGRMHDRPIGDLSDALAPLSVRFEWREKEGYPPFVLHTDGLPGGETSIALDQSSQYLSGLLLAAPMAAGEVIVNIAGGKAVSSPYVALTLQTLLDFGIDFSVERKDGAGWTAVDFRRDFDISPGATRFIVRPGRYAAGDYVVEGDWSNASYFLAAGAVGPRPVAVEGLRKDSLQGDKAMLDILQGMGALVSWEGDVVAVSAQGRLSGVDVDMGSCPDIVPTVAAVAVQAEGRTTIRNVAHLRIKESDRLSAVAEELGRFGARIDVLDDGLRIEPIKKSGDGREVRHNAHGDHRIAMSTAVMALYGFQPKPDDPGVVAKSFPTFWNEWAKVLEGL